jgi:hypothetical protein
MPAARRRALAVAACSVLLLTAGIGLVATPPLLDDGADQPRVNGSARFAPAHAANVTGAGVRVGIVDVTGFDTSAPALDGRVAAARAFGSGATVDNGGRDAHGTAAASVVARVAPDADLYLASFESPDSYGSAVRWLQANDVDVVVAPVSFYGTAGDGGSQSARLASEVTDSGTVFVASAGNLGRSHWVGRYDDVRDGRLRFGGGARNYLTDGGRRVVVWLSWDRAHADEDYTVNLYRTTDDGPQLVASSVPDRRDDVPNERIVARPRPGTYYLTVTGPDEPTGARLELSSPTHRLQYVRPSGSVVAPGTAPEAITVGAYAPNASRVEPYSSRGPTADGRVGVDVVAPDRNVSSTPRAFTGSSAAAPYVGGVAALVLQVDHDRDPAAVETLLERTATDVGPDGVDFAAGHGRVAPWRAVQTVRNASVG